MSQGLPTIFAPVNAGNTSEDLLSETCKIV